jgi:hypothetical protein
MNLVLQPYPIRRAMEFNRDVHRRRQKIQGGLWAVAVKRSGAVVGVAIVGRPCRALDEECSVLVVTRVACLPGDASPSGHKGCCSMLYGACSRAARAMGAAALFTYTDLDEPGTSLKAAGWADDGLTGGGEWDRPSRQRELAFCAAPKRRWRAPWSPGLAQFRSCAPGGKTSPAIGANPAIPETEAGKESAPSP